MENCKLNKVEIILDGSDSVYQCGHTINGSVNINLNGELNLSHLMIRLKSVAEVEFREYAYNIDGYAGHDFIFHDREQYLDLKYKLPEDIRNTVIKSGSHSIPFTFKLPDEGILTSFEDFRGFIKYWIEVIIKNDDYSSGEKDAFNLKKFFNVESPMLDNLKLAVGGGIEKNVGFMFIGSGKVRIDAFIRKKGHIPGEKLEVFCRLTNFSSVDVTPRICLSQILIYMADNRHLTLEERSEPVIGKQVNAKQMDDQTISIEIPSDISLSIKSRLISIKYFIHVTLDIPRERDLHLNLPIIITNKIAFDNYASYM